MFGRTPPWAMVTCPRSLFNSYVVILVFEIKIAERKSGEERGVTNLVVPDGQLQVTWDDTGLLVVTSGVTGQLKNLGGEVLKNRSEVYGSSGTDTLSVVALPQETVDTTDRESETGLSRAAVDPKSA